MHLLTDGSYMCFIRTINKCQGQTLRNIAVALVEPVFDAQGVIVRVDLQPCFAHGQLTVALTRVGHPARVCIYLDTVSYGRRQTVCPMYVEALIASSRISSGEVTFDRIFGDGLQEASDWSQTLCAAEQLMASGHGCAAVHHLLQYRPPVWGSEHCERWYQCMTTGAYVNRGIVHGLTAVTHEDYLAHAALCLQRAIDLFADADDDTGQWQMPDDGFGDRMDCAGYCGPPMDYEPAPISLGDDELALMAGNARAWNELTDDLAEEHFSAEELENLLSPDELSMWHASQDMYELGELADAQDFSLDDLHGLSQVHSDWL